MTTENNRHHFSGIIINDNRRAQKEGSTYRVERRSRPYKVQDDLVRTLL